jgi:hypothetical protein
MKSLESTTFIFSLILVIIFFTMIGAFSSYYKLQFIQSHTSEKEFDSYVNILILNKFIATILIIAVIYRYIIHR